MIDETSENPDTGAMAGLLNCINRRGRSRTDREVFVGQEKEGGARAWAWEPAREPNRSGANVEPDHARGLAIKGDGISALCGASTGAPVCSHAADRTAAIVGAMLAGLIGLVRSKPHCREQITAACRGSEAAMLAAQQAPIGAKICTNSAIRTMGRNFLSRRRIETTHPICQLIMQRVRSRDQVPGMLIRSYGRQSKPILICSNAYQAAMCRARISGPTRPTPIPGPTAARCNSRWRIPNHFADCSNFEQSLLKMVTRRKRWSTSAASGRPQG